MMKKVLKCVWQTVNTTVSEIVQFLFICSLGFQILFIKDCHKQQLSLCVPLFLGRRPATEWLNGLEYAISYSLASVLSETYLTLPALLKGMEVLTERLGMDQPVSLQTLIQ